MSLLKRDFVEKRITTLPNVPSSWEAGKGHFYQLDLHMCQLSTLHYDFKWGTDGLMDPQMPLVVEQPGRVLQLNVSVNDITTLDYQGLSPLSQLRALDASLNRIQRFMGVESLQHLRTLNLSYNWIRYIEGLDRCTLLTFLNLAANEIADLSTMPSLTNLTTLHLNNNKLKTLEGIQGLPHLKELYVQKNNLQDILPLSSSFHLVVLNAADNQISSLHVTVEVLKGLRHLQSLVLFNNPIEQAPGYADRLIEATNIITLDNQGVKSQPKPVDNLEGGRLAAIKEAARQAFVEKLRLERQKMEQSVSFLQDRIRAMKKDYEELEDRMESDWERFSNFVDSLPLKEIENYDLGALRHGIIPLQGIYKDAILPHSLPSQTNPQQERDSAVPSNRDTDELLRMACKELAKEQSKQLQGSKR